MTAFKKYLKLCSSQNVDSVGSIAKISIQIQMQTQISEKYHSRWNYNTTGIVYVELLGHDGNYNILKNDRSFEIF